MASPRLPETYSRNRVRQQGRQQRIRNWQARVSIIPRLAGAIHPGELRLDHSLNWELANAPLQSRRGPYGEHSLRPDLDQSSPTKNIGLQDGRNKDHSPMPLDTSQNSRSARLQCSFPPLIGQIRCVFPYGRGRPDNRERVECPDRLP